MTTNQAFIKAYRQDAAEPLPTRPAISAAARPAPVALGTTVQFVSAAAAPTAATYDTQTSAPVRERPTEGKTIWPTCDAPFGRIETSGNIAVSGKRPLSSYTAKNRAAARQAPPADEPNGRLEPATTIASFNWPTVCRALCQKCGPQLDSVADRLERQAAGGQSLIGMIGLFPNLGTTTTVLCVAARLAARRRRAIIVEGNFLAPRLASYLDATPTAWWQDVLSRHVPTADAIVRAMDDNLDLLPLDSKTAQPLRLAAGLQTFATAAALRNSYDIVLVDLGPFFDPDSQPITLELIRNMRLDAAIAVAGPQGADPRDLATLAAYLDPISCELIGTIENRIAQLQLSTSDP